MPKLTLSFISAFNERVEPLMNGTIEADGIELIPTYSHPSETFWRQLKFQEFEVAEMSMSSYLIARSRGVDMIAIPVFPSRRFFHAELSYHVDSRVKQPGDLVGKRIGVGQGDWSKVKPLFPDPIAEAKRFFTKYGFVPVNHTYIVRGDVYRAHPWIAVNLYAAFVKAKAYAREKLLERIPEALFFGPEYLTVTQQILGDDPFPYGVKANAAMLDTIIGYSNEQGLTPGKMKVDELFAAETLDL